MLTLPVLRRDHRYVLDMEFELLKAVSSEFRPKEFEARSFVNINETEYEDYARVSLMLWCVAVNKFRLARLFWQGTRDIIPNAVMATAILGELADHKVRCAWLVVQCSAPHRTRTLLLTRFFPS